MVYMYEVSYGGCFFGKLEISLNRTSDVKISKENNRFIKLPPIKAFCFSGGKMKLNVSQRFFSCLRLLVSIQKSAAVANKLPSLSLSPPLCISPIIQARSSKIKGMACVCASLEDLATSLFPIVLRC